jgi:hypothetical protein
MASQTQTRQPSQPGNPLPGLKPFLEVSARYLAVTSVDRSGGGVRYTVAGQFTEYPGPGCLAQSQPLQQARGLYQ